MTLDDAFSCELTNPKKGLHSLVKAITRTKVRIKLHTKQGDLAALKKDLLDMRVCVENLNRFTEKAIQRSTRLAINEKRDIMDLSVSPSKRT